MAIETTGLGELTKARSATGNSAARSGNTDFAPFLDSAALTPTDIATPLDGKQTPAVPALADVGKPTPDLAATGVVPADPTAGEDHMLQSIIDVAQQLGQIDSAADAKTPAGSPAPKPGFVLPDPAKVAPVALAGAALPAEVPTATPAAPAKNDSAPGGDDPAVAALPIPLQVPVATPSDTPPPHADVPQPDLASAGSEQTAPTQTIPLPPKPPQPNPAASVPPGVATTAQQLAQAALPAAPVKDPGSDTKADATKDGDKADDDATAAASSAPVPVPAPLLLSPQAPPPAAQPLASPPPATPAADSEPAIAALTSRPARPRGTPAAPVASPPLAADDTAANGLPAAGPAQPTPISGQAQSDQPKAEPALKDAPPLPVASDPKATSHAATPKSDITDKQQVGSAAPGTTSATATDAQPAILPTAPAHAAPAHHTAVSAAAQSQSVSQALQDLVVGNRQDDGWVDRLAQDIQTLTNGDKREAHLQLKPDALGSMSIKLEIEDKHTRVHFTVDNSMAQSIIADAAPKLQSLVEARGFKLDQTSVNVGSNGTGQGQGQQQGNGAQQPYQSRAPRSAAAIITADRSPLNNAGAFERFA